MPLELTQTDEIIKVLNTPKTAKEISELTGITPRHCSSLIYNLLCQGKIIRLNKVKYKSRMSTLYEIS